MAKTIIFSDGCKITYNSKGEMLCTLSPRSFHDHSIITTLHANKDLFLTHYLDEDTPCYRFDKGELSSIASCMEHENYINIIEINIAGSL
jgi:hypothetical protein